MNTGHPHTVVAVVAMDPEAPHRMDAASRAVVSQAASIVESRRGRLVLLMAPPGSARDILWSDAFALRILAEQRHRLLRAKRALRAEVEALFPAMNVTVRVANIHLADAVARFAREVAADLVVVSDRGLGLIGQWLIGPTLSAIVRKSPAPVLVVPLGAAAERREQRAAA